MQRSEGFEWAYRDLLLSLFVVCLAMAVMALLAVTPPKPTQAGAQVGMLTFEMQWPVGSDSDIDLWVRPPGDKPVGYARKAGKYCNLLRDDLGRTMDPASRAMEMTACRDAPAGEYVVNAHAYQAHGDELPIAVTVIVKLQHDNYNPPEVIAVEHATLTEFGEEATVVRFTLDSDAHIVPGSINHVTLPIRAEGHP